MYLEIFKADPRPKESSMESPADRQYRQRMWPHRGRARIFQAIEKERTHQDTLWGVEFDDKNTPNDWVTYMMYYLGQATAMDRETRRFDGKRFREELLKAATLCVAALEAFDRNNGMPPRHYDRPITPAPPLGEEGK